MFVDLDPSTIRPMPGLIVVEIVEVLGGTTRGGLFVPGVVDDHMGKDTVLCRVLRMGGLPTRAHRKTESGGFEEVMLDRPWPPELRGISVGDVVVFPRDVPLAFVWEEKRYAIVMEHEGIAVIPAADFDQKNFQVVPWKPAPTGAEADKTLLAEMEDDLDLLDGLD